MSDAVDRIREICLALPNVTEKMSHGEACWFIAGKRSFASFADHHHDDRIAVWCAAPPGVQEGLVSANPDRFFRPPYVGVKGWLGIYLDVPVDWQEVAEILETSYETVAAKLPRSASRPSP